MNNPKYNQCNKVFNSLVRKDQPLTVENLVTHSLFFKGGTISTELATDYLNKLVSIGFCQPKFYKQSVWRKANLYMKYLSTKGLVYPFDYGRGKGKYTTDIGIDTVKSYIGKL